MPNVRANGIDIEYDTFGQPANAPMLLIMGLGAQMVLWDEQFCEQLAERGHYVIRFDNRDVGLSTKFAQAGMPNVVAAVGAMMMRQPVEAPYTLSDMAADAMGLLDALDIGTAHIVGASMGGMIAQTVAIEHPKRVRTLTSIMSTTGNPNLPPAKPEAMMALMTPPPADRAGSIERSVSVFRTIGSPGFPFEEDRFRERAALSFDRCFHPEGAARQMVAILASGSRKEKLGAVTAPTLVIHGADDPLVPLAGGIDTAESIPGAELLIIEGMGHDLPRPAWPRIIDAISKLTVRG
ncbi:MAG TPA: alpha/beta hydrolase [Candidatus Kryptonia bacterium]|nr:alpha/beta hydrolase [Candidatus Kryptonia bacterium]